MKAALVAYRLMQEVARSHGGIGPDERALLDAYRRAMGLSAADLAAAEASDPRVLVEGSEAEREATVLALARVAHADGRLAARERAFVLEVAQGLGIGRVRAANLITHGEGEAHTRRLQAALASHRRGLLAAAALVLAAGALVAWRGRGRGPAPGGGALQAVAERADGALVLVHARYVLVAPDGRRAAHEGEGTGFFAGEGGWIVTCKHVVEPWKFLADDVRRLDQGWTLDPDSVRLSAWRPGAHVRERAGLDHRTAWDTAAATLELVAVAPDHWVRASRPLGGGGLHASRYHALDDADLALLRASAPTPPGLRLAPPEARPRRLDPVAVLGFPKGLALLEGEDLVSAPSAGHVRKVEDTIAVSADVFPGNSGGPLVDERGLVVGVAARRAGDESLGLCIRVAHVHALLDAAR